MRDLEVLAARREFTVTDSIFSLEEAKRKRYLSLWHVPADKRIEVFEQRAVIESSSTRMRLNISSIGRKPTAIKIMSSGELGISPVTSPSSGVAESVQILAFEWRWGDLHSTLRFHFDSH